MTAIQSIRITVGEGADARQIAVEQRPGAAPGLLWLNGFRSVMSGAKAMAVDGLGAERGLSVTRFDYSGHGLSGGAFDHGTISRWLEEAEAVLAITAGSQIAIGSSMGGWIALLLARRLLARGTPLKGLVLIAPAVDATTLIRSRMSAAQARDLATLGYYERDSAYGDGFYRYTRRLLDDGESHLMLGAVIETGCPVHILQGALDPDVPAAHAQKLLTHILHDPVSFTLVPDGDHRLSREEDLDRLRSVIMDMVGSLSPAG